MVVGLFMTHVKNARVFYRPLRGYSLDKQRAAVTKRFGTQIQMAEYIAIRDRNDERDQWLKDLRVDEVAVVPRLDVLSHRRANGRLRPMVDFATTLAALNDRKRCAFVVDAESGLTSSDGKKWLALVEWAANRVTSGRELSPRIAAKMAKTRWERAEPGVVELWHSPHMVDDLKRWGAVWRDPIYKNDREALAAMSDEVQQQVSSPFTARKIFGQRRPGQKAGGRPKKPRS